MAERTNPHANLIIGAQDEASPVFDKIKASSQSMAAGVEQAATKAAGAVGGIGDKAAPAAQKLDGITASMIRQVQRLNAELEAGGARNAAYFEKMASVKGADLSAMAPYLADLKKAEAAQRVATTGLDQMGMSAKQTTAALRQVPMQFTDIVVSLQGGQSAMQVFLQQGGQLKDLFGGAGNAARELGGYVAGLVNPFTMAAAAIASIAVAYKQGSAEADGYRMALVMTGNAAGTTAAQMQQMAGRISSVVGTQGAAAEALAQMASSGRVASQSLEYFSEVAIKFERTTGTAISETVKRFAELGASPVDASRKLNEETNYLTASIYEQIKALKGQGREADAAALAQTTYADALNNRSAQLTQNLGAIEGAWKAIQDAAKSGWDAMLNVGRADSLGTQIDNMRAKIAQAKGQDKNRPFSMPWDTSLEDLETQLSFLTEQERVIRRGAEAQAQRTQAEKEAIAATDALQKTQASGLTNQQKMNKALEEYARHIEKLKATNPASVLLSPDAIARGEKAIRDQFSDKGKGPAGIKAVNKDLADQARLIAELSGLTGTFSKDWDNLSAVYARGGMSMEQLVESQAALLAKQPFAVALAKEEAAATQALSKAYAEAAAERIKTIQSMERAADGLQSQNDALREEIELIGLSTEQQTLVLQQRNDVIILTKEATLAEMERQSAITGTQTRVEIALASEIEALKERNALLGAKGVKNAAVDAAKTAADEWQKTTDSINQTLTDALMRGFESGKDFAKNLRDTVVNMFKTMVLRPVVSAIVNPISQGITGMMGLSGAAQAGQGAGGALSTVGSIGSGVSMLSGLGAFGGGLAGGFGGLMGSMGLSAAGTTIGGAMSAGGIAMGAGNIMGGLGTIAGALGPIAIGLMLVASLIKKSTPHMGAASSYSAADGLTSGMDVYSASGFSDVRTYSAQAEAVTAPIARSLAMALDLTASTFGKKAGYEISTAFADDSSKDGAWGSLVISRDGEKLVDWRDTQTSRHAPREFADGEAGQKEYMTAIARDARDALKEAIGEVGWATGMLDALGDSPALEGLTQVVDQINAAKAAFDQFGKNLIGFAELSDAAVTALVKAAGGIDGLVASASTYYENFYSGAERAANTSRDVAAELARLGLEMPTTREGFRALVESQMALGESGAEAVAALFGVSGAFASVTQSAEEAAAMARASAEKARSSALAQLDASVQRERALWTAQADAAASLRDEVQGIFDTLATNIRDLRNEGMGEALSAAQGRVFIASAQAAVQAGAGLPDNDALADAIAAARGGIAASGAYGNSIEREFAALALAGELAVLQEAAGEQLSTAELQLRAAESQIEQIDETLVYWRKLIDGTNAGIDATLSVADAVRSLQGLMFPEAEQPDAPAPGSSGDFSIGGGGGGGGGAPAPTAASLSRLGNTYLGAGGTAIVDRAYIDRFDSINQFVNTLDFSASGAAATSVAALSSAALQYGVSANEIAIATGYRLEDVEALLPGIPRYKRGTNFVPEDGLAFLHKGEQVLPVAPQGAPYQPPMADNSQVVALLQQIAQRVAALESHASTSADANTQTADVLTRASQGDALTTAAAPTIA